MRCKEIRVALFALTVSAGFGHTPARADERASGLKSVLTRNFDLGKRRSPGTRYFTMVTTWVSFEPDGKRGEAETYRAKLKCVSQGEAAAGYRYTCKRFIYVKPDGTQVSIPALEGWTYTSRTTETGLDEKGYVFGIDHARFQQLTDDNGKLLGPDKSYLIYNSFIDFHGSCDHFAILVAEGQGIQHLTRIGQRIVHASAHSKAPVNLGRDIKEGSFFRNGEITLMLKGLGIIDDAPCAIVGFDSGVASFEMLMEPTPGLEVKGVGASHYFGDIYVDLASRWTRKVAMGELVISQTKVPMPGTAATMTIDSIQERKTSSKQLQRKCSRETDATVDVVTDSREFACSSPWEWVRRVSLATNNPPTTKRS